jgi:transglutaminase-like putative cysteine protease
MTIAIETHLVMRTDAPTDILLQYEAAAIPEQVILTTSSEQGKALHCARIAADEDIGARFWLRLDGQFELHYRAEVQVQRVTADLVTLPSLPPHLLPADTVKYLFDSRYCQGDSFQSYATSKFGDASGGAQIDAMRQWINETIAYEPGSSNAETSARDTIIDRKGVCRDFAHVLITLARASGIPARYVAVYGPQVEPADFHAIAEVFLADPTTAEGGAWYPVDATGMVTARDAIKIGVGRDAADVSFLTSFGTCDLVEKSVRVWNP